MTRRAPLALALALLGAACKEDKPLPAAPAPSTPPSAPAPVVKDAGADPGAALDGPARDKELNPAGNPVYTGPTGSIEGTVFVTGAPAPDSHESFEACPNAASMYGKVFRDQPAAGGKRTLGDAIVGVTGYDGMYVRPTTTAQSVAVKDCAFATRTLVLTLGDRLDVRNADPPGSKSLYGFTLVRNGASALRVAAPSTDPIRFYPKEPGRDRLADNLDRRFLAIDVFVVRFPLHAVTTLDGHFRVDGIPVGKRKLNVTHPTFDSNTTIDVEVKADAVTTQDVTVTFKPPPAASATPSAAPSAPPR